MMETKASRSSLVVHGGAGHYIKKVAHQKGIEAALLAGSRVLTAKGSALDAVIAAVKVLEHHCCFNAGRGSVPCLNGAIEVDAALMLGNGRFGAVAAMRGVKHPIEVARMVMEKTDHLILSGSGADRFARACGFRYADLLTEPMKKKWQEGIKRLRLGDQQVAGSFQKLSQWLEPLGISAGGTVGAVARDHQGHLAAATSTGGRFLKMPGRIGDTPVPGAGTWADPVAAVSATGEGEGILTLSLSRMAAQLVASGLSPQDALNNAIQTASTAKVGCGLILVDHTGQIASAYNTTSMVCGHWSTTHNA